MRTSIEWDDDLVTAMDRAVSLLGEKSATVLRLAICAGLPVIEGRFQSLRPEGYLNTFTRTKRGKKTRRQWMAQLQLSISYLRGD